MALIGTIRKNGWILIAMMTLALGGFILMEIIENAQRTSAGDVNTLGKVNGEEIKRNEFESFQELVYANSQGNTFQIRNQIWNYFVENAIVAQISEELGLGVGKEELNELQFGNSISPIIAERFKGNDGQVNRATLASIKAAIEGGQFTDPVNRAYWATQEKEVIKDRLQSKIINLVSKGLYTPQWQAEATYRENNERVDFVYVRIPFEKVADADAQVTDADYSAYLKENPKLYDQTDETREISYASIDVLPSLADSASARSAVEKLVEGLRTTTNDSSYVVANDGVYDSGYKLKAALPPSIADTLLRQPLGSIIGPFLDGGVWNVAKILDRRVIADSVRARHILSRGTTPASERKIDSLMGLLNSGNFRFDSLAVKNSEDGSAPKGGDLGFFPLGAMVPEFNNVCFFTGVQGKYYKVSTQFGWHIIEITDKKFIKNEAGVKAVYLSQRIQPGKATQQAFKEKAIQLVQDGKTLSEILTLAGQRGFQVQNVPGIKANDFTVGTLGTGEDSREIVRWAFNEDTDVDEISKDVFSFRDANGGYFDSKYVIAGLKSIAPAGASSVATLKANQRADMEVKNRKKAAVILSKLQNAGDLNALASQWEVKIDTAKGSNLLQTFLPNGGTEPRVVGTAFFVAKGSVSKPVTGNTGVYVLMPTSEKPKLPAPPDLTLFRRQANSSASSNVRMNLLTELKKQAEVRDNRSKFF